MFAEEENARPSATKNKEIKFPVLIMRRFSPRSMESVPFIFFLINSTLNQDILALAKNIPANKPVKDKFIKIGVVVSLQ